MPKQPQSPSAIAEALAASAVAPPPVAPPQNPYILNEPLEQAAQPDRAPLHPMVAAIMHHLGLMSALRNRGNQQVVDPQVQEDLLNQ